MLFNATQAEELRVAIVEHRRFLEIALRRRGLFRRRRVHQRRHRRRQLARQLQDLRHRGVDAEVEGELSRLFREQVAEHGAERHAIGQLGVGLSQQREIWKRVVGVAAAPQRTNDPPLRHVAKMIVAQESIALEDVALRDR